MYWTAIVVCSLAGAAPADEAAPSPTAERIAALVEDLGHDDFARRRNATRALIAIGDPVTAAVYEATESENPEVRRRARRVLGRLVHRDLLERFTALGAKPDHEVDVEEGMWLIARVVDPRVRRAEVDRSLDQLAERVRKQVEKAGIDKRPREIPPRNHMDAIRHVLFEKEGFTGNERSYDDPRNSSIVYVLETKRGLPILLSHVVVAVARRAEIPVYGLAVSGRYMCYYDATRQPGGPRGSRVINPFAGGEVMTAAEARTNGYSFDAFSPDPARNALVRMLRNLESDYEQAGRVDMVTRVERYRALLEAGPADATK